MAAQEEIQKRQYALGRINAEKADRIEASWGRFKADIREITGQRINNKEFISEVLDTFGSFVQIWVKTNLSRSQARFKAKVDAGTEDIMEDINKRALDLLRELLPILQEVVREELEKRLLEESAKQQEQKTGEAELNE